MAPVTIMDMKISPAFPKGILTAVSGRGTAAVDRSLRPRCFSAFQLTISKHPKPSPLF